MNPKTKIQSHTISRKRVGQPRLAKTGATIASDFFDSLRRLSELLEARRRPSRSVVVYGGESAQQRTHVRVIPWRRIASGPWD